MNPYSSDKVMWHVDRIQTLRKGQDITPTHLQLIISDLCNENCNFCAYRREDGFSYEQFHEGSNINPNRKIPTQKCYEILGDCAKLGVRAIQFTGGGEPTVHEDHVDIFEFALNQGLECAMVTNGTKVAMDYSEFQWLRVSLDCGTEESYEKIRGSKQWSNVLGNIETLARLTGPLVGVGFVMTRMNFHELHRACEIVKDLGVKYVRVSAMFSHQGSKYYHYIFDQCVESIAHAKRLEDEDFKVIDLFGDRIADLDIGRPNYGFCGTQQFVNYIGGDQKVYTCCTNAYTKHGEIGDLQDQSYADWLSTTRRYGFDARSCHHCQFNDKNQIIDSLLISPLHKNFI